MFRPLIRSDRSPTSNQNVNPSIRTTLPSPLLNILGFIHLIPIILVRLIVAVTGHTCLEFHGRVLSRDHRLSVRDFLVEGEAVPEESMEVGLGTVVISEFEFECISSLFGQSTIIANALSGALTGTLIMGASVRPPSPVVVRPFSIPPSISSAPMKVSSSNYSHITTPWTPLLLVMVHFDSYELRRSGHLSHCCFSAHFLAHIVENIDRDAESAGFSFLSCATSQPHPRPTSRSPCWGNRPFSRYHLCCCSCNFINLWWFYGKLASVDNSRSPLPSVSLYNPFYYSDCFSWTIPYPPCYTFLPWSPRPSQWPWINPIFIHIFHCYQLSNWRSKNYILDPNLAISTPSTFNIIKSF